MLTVHGSPISPFVRKVLVLLAEKGVDCEINPVKPFPASAEHLVISPTGKIPALTDGDFSLPDSSAICAYLERKYPDKNLYPLDPEAYGRALWYQVYADTVLVGATSAFFFQKVAVKMMGREPDEVAIQAIRDNTEHKVFSYLEGEIGDREFIVDGQFSIADIAISCHLVQRLYAQEPIDSEQYPNITRYLGNQMQRQTFKTLINNDALITID